MSIDYVWLGPWLDFVVRGTPVPQGSVRHFGRGRPSVHGNQDTLLPWREQIQHAAESGIEDHQKRNGIPPLSGFRPQDFPLDGPLALGCEFTMRKPTTAPKTKRTYPTARPDTSKLLRAVEDSLVAAGAIRDDSLIVDTRLSKCYPLETARSLPVPGVRVKLFRVIIPDPNIVVEEGYGHPRAA